MTKVNPLLVQGAIGRRLVPLLLDGHQGITHAITTNYGMQSVVSQLATFLTEELLQTCSALPSGSAIRFSSHPYNADKVYIIQEGSVSGHNIFSILI